MGAKKVAKKGVKMAVQNLAVEYVGIDTIEPYEHNARKHCSKDLAAIKKSIEEFGFNDPIGIWHNQIVEGHGRLLAAQELGFTEIPIIRLDNLTDEQRRAYTLAHNKTAELSDWDFDVLAEEIKDIADFDMSEFGFDLEDFESETTEIEEDEIPDVPEEATAKLGDIWELGGHRLVCGDSTDVALIDKLLDGEKVELLFTDPPYNMIASGGGILKKANSMKQIIENKVDSFDPAVLTLYGNTNIFCHNKMLIKNYIELAEANSQNYDLAFYKKTNTVPNYKGHLMTDVEYIAIIGKQDPNKGLAKEDYSKCFIGQKDKDNELSYSKPVALCAKYIKLYSKHNVLDLFGGSGSTLIACEQLGRRCFMCELNPKYVDVIIKRWENFTGQKAVLLNDAKTVENED